MTETIELILRWIIGLQFTFWGLNSFFQWKKVPPAGAVIENFVAACIESRFIMPTVKTFEILFGCFLLADFLTPLALVMLAPIVFVFTGLHLLHNPKAWGVIAPLSLPFVVLTGMHFQDWLILVGR